MDVLFRPGGGEATEFYLIAAAEPRGRIAESRWTPHNRQSITPQTDDDPTGTETFTWGQNAGSVGGISASGQKWV